LALVGAGTPLVVKRLAVLGSLAAVGAVVVRKVRRGRGDEDAPDNAWSNAPTSTEPTEPPVPEVPSAADPGDREQESRSDEESAYERKLEGEQAARTAAAERLRSDPPEADTAE
jgi:hypothetical protein